MLYSRGMQPLPSTAALLGHAWRTYLRDLRHTFELSIWLLVPGLVLLLGAFAGSSLDSIPSSLAFGGAFVLFILLTVFVAQRMTAFILQKETRPDLRPQDVPWATPRQYGSFFLVQILEGLAALGGILLLFLPGIWAGVSLMFSRYFNVAENKRGLEALSASIALVKGRWWAVFGRSLVAGILFTFLLSLGTFLVSTLVGVVAGFDRVDALLAPEQITPLSQALNAMVQSVAQVILAPLLITWQVTLFRALRSA